jgi:hypothetical protein
VPTTAELDRLVAANRAIRDRATKDVKALWVALAGLTAEQARDALIAAMPALIARYGEIAATIAADFYDEQRDIASAPSRYTADLAPVADPKAIAASGAGRAADVPSSRALDNPRALSSASGAPS